jgi:hypothetical protein
VPQLDLVVDLVAAAVEVAPAALRPDLVVLVGLLREWAVLLQADSPAWQVRAEPSKKQIVCYIESVRWSQMAPPDFFVSCSRVRGDSSVHLRFLTTAA